MNTFYLILNVSRLLYDHFFFDISDKIHFNQTVVELGLECYLQILHLVASHFKKLDKFLRDSSKYKYYSNPIFITFFIKIKIKKMQLIQAVIKENYLMCYVI